MQLLAPTTITIQRYPAEVAWIDGFPVAVTPSEISIRGAVTPASKATTSRMPEGVRVSHVVDLYTYAEIKAVDEQAKTKADRFMFGGRLYEVQDVTRFPAFMGEPAHWEGYAMQVAALPMPTEDPP